eukprot:GILK01009177.1.p1 GENE.GILK01009177.1~~GILK01009177.1.p1  ORF type:complete len:864 (-),score=247.79 GILK01009177.1:181-2772(-)
MEYQVVDAAMAALRAVASMEDSAEMLAVVTAAMRQLISPSTLPASIASWNDIHVMLKRVFGSQEDLFDCSSIENVHILEQALSLCVYALIETAATRERFVHCIMALDESKQERVKFAIEQAMKCIKVHTPSSPCIRDTASPQVNVSSPLEVFNSITPQRTAAKKSLFSLAFTSPEHRTPNSTTEDRDLISELKQQLSSMASCYDEERQFRAEAETRISEHVRTISLLQVENQELQTRVSGMNQLEEELAVVRSKANQVTKLESQLNKYKSRLDEASNQISALKTVESDKNRLSRELAEQKERSKNWEADKKVISQYREQLNQKELSNTELKAANLLKDEEIKRLIAANSDLNRRQAESIREIESLNQVIFELNSDASRLHQDSTSLQQNLQHSISTDMLDGSQCLRMADLQTENEEVKKKLETVQDDRIRLERSLEDMEALRNAIEQKYMECQLQLAEQQVQLNQTLKTVEELTGRLKQSASQEEVESLRSDCEKLSASNAFLKDQLESAKSDQLTAQNRFKSATAEYNLLNNELRTVKQKLIDALSARTETRIGSKPDSKSVMVQATTTVVALAEAGSQTESLIDSSVDSPVSVVRTSERRSSLAECIELTESILQMPSVITSSETALPEPLVTVQQEVITNVAAGISLVDYASDSETEPDQKAVQPVNQPSPVPSVETASKRPNGSFFIAWEEPKPRNRSNPLQDEEDPNLTAEERRAIRKRRNDLLLPHLRSSYAVETQYTPYSVSSPPRKTQIPSESIHIVAPPTRTSQPHVKMNSSFSKDAVSTRRSNTSNSNSHSDENSAGSVVVSRPSTAFVVNWNVDSAPDVGSLPVKKLPTLSSKPLNKTSTVRKPLSTLRNGL